MYVFIISICIVAAAFMVQRFANQIDEQLNACGTGTFKDGACVCQHPYTGAHCEIVDCGYGKLVDSVFAYDTITTPNGPAGCECENQYWGFNCLNCTSKYSGSCTGPCKDRYFGARCDILCKSGTENDAEGVLHRQSGGTYNYFVESHGFCLNYGDVVGTVKCREGRAGAHCELECPNCVYGKCNLDDGTCDCFDGYFGDLCEGTCPGRCSGLNGVCQEDGTCNCYDGFTGADCSLECCVEGRGTDLGSVHGECAHGIGGCQCFEENIPHSLPDEMAPDLDYYGIGWQGSECDCHENVTCGGRGTCGDGECICAPNFQGARCDICADDKIGPFCQYDRWQCPDKENAQGEFVARNNRGDYACKCNSGFTGPTCEECIASAYPKSGDKMCTIIIPDSLCNNGRVNPDYDGTGDMCICDGNFDEATDCASCNLLWYGPDCDHYCHTTCTESRGVCSNSAPGCLCPKGTTFEGTKSTGGSCVFCGGDEGCENGNCIEGRCRCDPNYYGDNCKVTPPLTKDQKICNGYPSIVIEESASCNATVDCTDESEGAPNVQVAYRARLYDRVNQTFCHRDDTPKGLKNTRGCCVDREGDGFCDADKLEDMGDCTFTNAAGLPEDGEIVNDICNKRVLENEVNVFEWCLSKERACTMNGECEDPDLCQDRCDAGIAPSGWINIWEYEHTRTMADVMSETWKFASNFSDPYEFREFYDTATINDVCVVGDMYDVCRDYLIPDDANVFNLTHKFTGKWESMPNYQDCTLTKTISANVDGKKVITIDPPVYAGVIETLQENTVAFARYQNGDEAYTGTVNHMIDSITLFAKGQVDVLIYNYTSDTCSDFVRKVGSHHDMCSQIKFYELDYDWGAFCKWRPTSGSDSPAFDDRCYRQSTVCTAGCDNYQEGCEGLPLLSEFPAPMPAPCDQHWDNFCTNYMDYNHKEEGVCAYTQCACEGYGVGGPACDLQCPVPAGISSEQSCGAGEDPPWGQCLRDRGVIAFGFEQGRCECFNGGDPNLGCTAVCEGEQDCSSNVDTPFSFTYDNCTNLADIDDSKSIVELGPNSFTCHVWLRDSICNFFRGRCECATPFTVFDINERPMYLNPHNSYRIALMQGYEIDEYLPFTTYNGTVPDREREAFDANDPNFKCFKDIEHTQEVPCDWIRALKHFARGGSYRIGDCHNLAPGTDIEYQVPCSGQGFPQGGTCACDYAEEFELRSSGVGLAFEQPGLTQTPWRGKACQYVCPGYDMKSMDTVCSGHGRCESDARCACDQGWTGFKCDLRCEAEQKPLTCSGHGVCDERNIIIRGDISEQFMASNCEHLPECTENDYDPSTGPCTNETLRLAMDRVVKDGNKIYHMYEDGGIKVTVNIEPINVEFSGQTILTEESPTINFQSGDGYAYVVEVDQVTEENPDIEVCQDFSITKLFTGHPLTITKDGTLLIPGWSNSGSLPFTNVAPGEYEYYCTTHPNMKGTITVKQCVEEKYLRVNYGDDSGLNPTVQVCPDFTIRKTFNEETPLGGDMVLHMQDSWGDGWNGYTLDIGGTSYTFSSGYSSTGIITGSEGTYYVSRSSTSYFENEVSWSIKCKDDPSITLVSMAQGAGLTSWSFENICPLDKTDIIEIIHYPNSVSVTEYTVNDFEIVPRICVNSNKEVFTYVGNNPGTTTQSRRQACLNSCTDGSNVNANPGTHDFNFWSRYSVDDVTAIIVDDLLGHCICSVASIDPDTCDGTWGYYGGMTHIRISTSIGLLKGIEEIKISGGSGRYKYQNTLDSSMSGFIEVEDCTGVSRPVTLGDFFVEGTAVRHDYGYSSDIPFMPCVDRLNITREQADHPLLAETTPVILPCNVRAKMDVREDDLGRQDIRFNSYQVLCGVCDCEEKSSTGNWTGYDCRTPALGFYRNDGRSQCPGMTGDMKPCNGGGTCKWGSTDGLGTEISVDATKCYCGETSQGATVETAPRYQGGILVHAESFGTPIYFDVIDEFPRVSLFCNYSDVQTQTSYCYDVQYLGRTYAGSDNPGTDAESRKEECYKACANLDNKFLLDSDDEGHNPAFWSKYTSDDIHAFTVEDDGRCTCVARSVEDCSAENIATGTAYSTRTPPIYCEKGAEPIQYAKDCRFKFKANEPYNLIPGFKWCGRSDQVGEVHTMNSQDSSLSIQEMVFNCYKSCLNEDRQNLQISGVGETNFWAKYTSLEIKQFSVFTSGSVLGGCYCSVHDPYDCPEGAEMTVYGDVVTYSINHYYHPYDLSTQSIVNTPEITRETEGICAKEFSGEIFNDVLRPVPSYEFLESNAHCYTHYLFDGTEITPDKAEAYPRTLNPGEKHYDPDKVQECANRCNQGVTEVLTKAVSIHLQDSSGDGWNGYMLEYISTTGLSHIKMTSGSSKVIPLTDIKPDNNGKIIFLRDERGSRPSEVSWQIKCDADDTVLAEHTDMYTLFPGYYGVDFYNNCPDIETRTTFDGFALLNYVENLPDTCICGRDCLTTVSAPFFTAYSIRQVPAPYETDLDQSLCHPKPLALTNYKSDCSCKFGFTGSTCETPRMMCLWSGEETDGTECICRYSDGTPNNKVSKYGCCTIGTYWDQDKYASFTPLNEFEAIPESPFYANAMLYVCKAPDTLLEFPDDQSRITSIHNYVANTDEYYLTRPSVCVDKVDRELFTPVFKTFIQPSPAEYTVELPIASGSGTETIYIAKDVTTFPRQLGVDPAIQCAEFCVSKQKGYKGFTLFKPKPVYTEQSSGKHCFQDDYVTTYSGWYYSIDDEFIGMDPNPGRGAPNQDVVMLDACKASCQEAPRYAHSKFGRSNNIRPTNFWDVYTKDDITHIGLIKSSSGMNDIYGNCICFVGNLDTCETNDFDHLTIYTLEQQNTQCTCEPFEAFMDNRETFVDPLLYEDSSWNQPKYAKSAKRYDIQFPIDLEAKGQNLDCFKNIDETVIKVNEAVGTDFSITPLPIAYTGATGVSKNATTLYDCYLQCKGFDIFRFDATTPCTCYEEGDTLVSGGGSYGLTNINTEVLMTIQHNSAINPAPCNVESYLGLGQNIAAEDCVCPVRAIEEAYVSEGYQSTVVKGTCTSYTVTQGGFPPRIQLRYWHNWDDLKSRCDGDCNKDSDCIGHLKCFQRNPGDEGAPFDQCSGYLLGDYDYCYDPTPDTPVETANKGSNPSQLLGRCEGDCDTDKDCGNGLVCFQRGYSTGLPVSRTGTSYSSYNYKGYEYWHCNDFKAPSNGPKESASWGLKITNTNDPFYEETIELECARRCRQDGETIIFHVEGGRCACGCFKRKNFGGRLASFGFNVRTYQITHAGVSSIIPGCTGSEHRVDYDFCVPGEWSKESIKSIESCGESCDKRDGCNSFSFDNDNNICLIGTDCDGYEFKFYGSCVKRTDDVYISPYHANNPIPGMQSGVGYGIAIPSIDLCRDYCVESRGFVYHEDYKMCLCENDSITYLGHDSCDSGGLELQGIETAIFTRYQNNFIPTSDVTQDITIYKKKMIPSTKGRYCPTGEVLINTYSITDPKADDYACAFEAKSLGFEMSRSEVSLTEFLCYGYDRYYADPDPDKKEVPDVCYTNPVGPYGATIGYGCDGARDQGFSALEDLCDGTSSVLEDSLQSFYSQCCRWTGITCVDKYTQQEKARSVVCPVPLDFTARPQYILEKGLQRKVNFILAPERYQNKLLVDFIDDAFKFQVQSVDDCLSVCNPFSFRHFQYASKTKTCICIKQQRELLEFTGDKHRMGFQLYDYTLGLIKNAHEMCYCEGFALVDGIPKACPSGRYSSKLTPCSATCELCPTGKFSTPGSSECGGCLPGEIQSSAISCSKCPVGKYAESGDISCTDCPVATFASAEGSSFCTQCDAGRFQHPPLTGQNVSTTCRICPGGWSQGQLQSTSCNSCGTGKYTNGDEAPACISCAAGKYQDLNNQDSSTACKDCAVGKYQNSAGQSSCESCDPGKYQNQVGQIKCKDCNKGYYQNQGGQSGCKNCGGGYYQNQNKQTGCKGCPKGWYQNQDRQTGCKTCDHGQYTDQNSRSGCKKCGTSGNGRNGLYSGYKWVTSPHPHVSYEYTCDQYKPCGSSAWWQKDCGTKSNAQGKSGSGYGDYYRKCCNYQDNFFCSSSGWLCDTFGGGRDAQGSARCSSSSGGGFGLSGFVRKDTGRGGISNCEPPTDGKKE